MLLMNPLISGGVELCEPMVLAAHTRIHIVYNYIVVIVYFDTNG